MVVMKKGYSMSQGPRHVVKYTYDNGVKLPLHKQVLWCSADPKDSQNYYRFQDAQHLAICSEITVMLPCKDCVKAIINALEKGL